MDFDALNFFKLLKENSSEYRAHPEECSKLLTKLNSLLIGEELNPSNLDTYIILTFDDSFGIPKFIKDNANKKLFKAAVLTGLEVLYTLLNNCTEKVKKYIMKINETCMLISKSSITSADEKVKALELLSLSFTKVNIIGENEESYTDMYKSLRSSLAIKKADSAMEKLFIAIGRFEKHFHYLVVGSDFKTTILVLLEKELLKQQFSNQLVSGLFTALSDCCYNSPLDPTNKEDFKRIIKIFKYIKDLAVPQGRIKTGNRAALTFLTNNISIFPSECILKESKGLHSRLIKWLDMGHEDCKTGYGCLFAFYKELAGFLTLKILDTYKTVVMYFKDHFMTDLKSNEVTNYKKRLAIHGLRLFCEAMYKQLPKEEVNELFLQLIHNFEQTYIIEEDTTSEQWEYLPDHVELISEFLKYSNESYSHILCLQKAVIIMIKTFPKVRHEHHSLVIESIILSSHSQKVTDPKIFDKFIDQIVYQGVLWTCSHQLTFESELGDNKLITVHNYLPLWSGLVVCHRKVYKAQLGLDASYTISLKIVEKLIKTLLVLVNKLNVSVDLKDADAPVTSIESAYKVQQISDFAVFLNVVEFYQEIMLKIEPDMFNKCIYKLIDHFIEKCCSYTLISGFYKLLSSILKIAQKLEVFQCENSINKNSENCIESLIQFIKQVLTNMKLYKDELLISCLEVLLECPLVVVKEVIDACVPAFITVFTVGRSHIPLAELGLRTLEQWKKELSIDQINPVLEKIAPFLDTYIRSKSLTGKLQDNVIEKKRKTTKAMKARTVVIEIEPELVNFQRKIINFLGKQNSALCSIFVSANSYLEPAVITSRQYLKITLPYEDVKVDIFIDDLLSRVLELAINSSDRKIRIAACELLHATVMVFLGESRTFTERNTLEQSDMNEIFKKMLPSLFRLGCDVDFVVQQLFKPLVFQLIHWYTHPIQLRTSTVASLIEAMMEGITHPTDSLLRDFSGECIKEFITWTIKQTPERNLIVDSINIKVMVHKMRFYSTHPDDTKKLGAALIFNNIYRELREEKPMLSMFWIELLHIFVTSLVHIENSDLESEQCVKQIKQAIDHLLRGFTEKSDLFNKEDSDRRKPHGFSGSLLKDVYLWILQMTGSKSTYCREVCMKIFNSLTPLVKGIKTPFKIASFYKNEISWIKEMYEDFIIQYPTLENCKSYSLIQKWIHALLCALDGYHFVIRNNLVKANLITDDSQMVKAVNYFLKNIIYNNLEQVIMLVINDENSESLKYPSTDKEIFRQLKLQIIVKILHLGCTLVEVMPNNVELFLNNEMWKFLTNILFAPHLFGLKDKESKCYAPILQNFCNEITTKLVPDIKKKFSNEIMDFISNFGEIAFDPDRSVTASERNFFSGLILLQHSGFNREVNLNDLSQQISEKVLQMFFNTEEVNVYIMPELTESSVKYFSLVLKFILTTEGGFQILMKYFYDQRSIKSIDLSYEDLSFGEYLFNLFKEPFAEALVDKYELFLSYSFSSQDHINLAVKNIIQFLGFLNANKRRYSYSFHSIAKITLTQIESITEFFDLNIHNSIIGFEFISLITNMLQKDIRYEILTRHLIALILREESYFENQDQLDIQINALGRIAIIFNDDTELLENYQCAMRKLVHHFSEMSSTKSENEQTVYISKLLSVLAYCKSVTVAHEILQVFAVAPKKAMKDYLDVLLKVLVRSFNKEEQLVFINKLYDSILENCEAFTQNAAYRNYVFNNIVLTPIFNTISSQALVGFFQRNLERIIISLQNNITEQNMNEKMLNLILLELLFGNTTSDDLQSIADSLNITSPLKKANIKNILLKILLDVFKDCPSVCEENKNNLRLLKCCAFNSLSSFLCNHIKKENFFTKLFIRYENNQDILWKSLIDTNLVYKFNKDFETLPKKRSVLTSIRTKIRQEMKMEIDGTASIRYIESQHLFNSSLNEDITRYDMSKSVLRSQTNEDFDQINNSDSEQAKIQLEDTEVNQHECMATVCGVVAFIFESGISELPVDKQSDSMPIWMDGIRELLLSDEVHINIKIFFIKVIDNMSVIFSHYAKFFLEALLKFACEQCAVNSFNYFVTDIVSLLISWNSIVRPSNENEVTYLSKIVELLIKEINNERTDMFKYHLELLKLLIESWKSLLNIPAQAIISHLSVDYTSKKVEIGIHIAAVFLANNLEPWDEYSKQPFLDKILSITKSTTRSTYRTCAEVIGLSLKMLSNNADDDEYCNKVQIIMKNISIIDFDKYLTILEGIVMHYPKIADDNAHLSKILFRLNMAPSNVQATILKICLKRSDILNSTNDYQIIDWDKYAGKENLDVQINTMLIILECIDTFETLESFPQIIQAVLSNISNPNKDCRNLAFEIAMVIFKTNSLSSDRFTSVSNICKETIIQGLIDEDTDIREKVYEFLLKDANVPRNLSLLVTFLLTELYLPSTEDHFLCYSTYILTSILNEMEECEQKLFNGSLADCEFEEYILQTNWRIKHPSVVPMFAETLRTYDVTEDFEYSRSDFNKLRQTQNNFTFAPTKSLSKELYSQYTQSESSLYVTPIAYIDGTFKNPNEIALLQDYKTPRRRFLKDRHKVSRHFASEEIKKGVKKVQKRYSAAKEKEKKVSITRSYRKGDLPDIEITLSSILKPLQLLTLNDGEVSKILFGSIFNSISQKCSSKMFYDSVSDALKNIFENSINFNNNMFRTFFDILLMNIKDISLKTELISSVCRTSGLISTGTLLLEECIIAHEEDDEPICKKSSVSSCSKETLLWTQLSGLYKELDDWDVVEEIFLAKMGCSDNVQRALTAESQKKWRESLVLYKELIDIDSSLDRKDFYYESYFKCFAYLSEWEELSHTIKNFVSPDSDFWNSIWDGDWNQEKLLPWYINAQVKTMIFSNKLPEEFCNNINSSMIDSQKSEYLRCKFAEELCMMWIFNSNLDQANLYLKLEIDRFLEDWQGLDPMFLNHRFTKILKLRNIIEISTFISSYESLDRHNYIDTVERLCADWKETSDESLSTLIMNETKFLYRKQFITLLMKKVNEYSEGETCKDVATVTKKMKRTLAQLNSNLINSAIDQENFYMARKYFKEVQGFEVDQNINLARTRILILKANLCPSDEEKMKTLRNSITHIDDTIPELTKDPISLLQANLLRFDIVNKIVQISNDHSFLSQQVSSVDNLKKLLEDFEILSKKAKKETREKLHLSIADAYNKLAYFVDNQREGSLSPDFIKFILKGMKLGSVPVRQLFPCILMNKDLVSLHGSQFINEAENVPTWMFLKWIPQLLSLVDTPNVEAVSKILIRIATLYPQALMYSYMLSKESYKLDDINLPDTKHLIEKLNQLLLSNAVIDKVLEAFSNVSVPVVVLKTYVEKIIKAAINNNTEGIKSFQDTVLTKFYNRQSPNSRDMDNMLGNKFKEINDYKKDFQVIGSNVTSVRKKFTEIYEKLTEKSRDKRTIGSFQLKDFCPWLANFTPNSIDFELEIPGQYDGEKMPLTEHHVKISGFRPTVTVLNSIRRPIKLTILGNNTREYSFLVKFGEDLRQDQRIEQLFTLMNSIFQEDNYCCQHNLSIATYQVIPLRSNLGLLQWVDDTMKLEELVAPTEKDENQLEKLKISYVNFINRKTGIPDVDRYGQAAIKIDREKTIAKFNELKNGLPWDTLKKSFWKLSINTESFIALRNNFIRSYSVMCISHWLLGIGDRHLSNTLVSKRNGKVLGIDFGHAFGTGTQILGVPELVPFRLTPQIINLMAPFEERGQFKQTMIHSLNTLRMNRQPLIATMLVFITEPSLDWIQLATRFDNSSDPSSIEWFPKQKISQAKQKLYGSNPTSIMIEELKSGQRNREQYVKSYIVHVEGDPSFNVRARKAKVNLSVEEQVECLIDHAKDFNLLGRMYVGWVPWV